MNQNSEKGRLALTARVAFPFSALNFQTGHLTRQARSFEGRKIVVDTVWIYCPLVDRFHRFVLPLTP